MNIRRSCLIFMVILKTINSQIAQSFMIVQQLGTNFIPANPIELIANYNDISTFDSCYNRCYLNFKCRTVVSDTTWPFICQLYEGSIDTGTLIPSSSSTSRVSNFLYNATDYSHYNQTCNINAFTLYRFLMCSNGLWCCPDATYWNGSICLNAAYYNHSCNTNDACRSDVGLLCDPVYHKCLCNSMMIWNNTSCINDPSMTITWPNPTSMNYQNCSQVWQQCGGQTWTGPTCCINSTCIYSGPYYSQCQPISGSLSSSSTLTSSTGSSTTVSVGNGRLNGITTRYWDCCKVSCGWPGKASVTNPVQTCEIDGITPIDMNTQSVCNSGTAFTCNNQQPWSVNNTFSYGFSSVNINNQNESIWCCACYSIIFTSGPVIGKEMIVQATNTGADLSYNHFDLQIPGGGLGYFSGCLSQYNGSYSWGQQYGGVSNRSDCANLPTNIQGGCYWRFDWFMNADNPNITFIEVPCPTNLTSRTNCVRN